MTRPTYGEQVEARGDATRVITNVTVETLTSDLAVPSRLETACLVLTAERKRHLERQRALDDPQRNTDPKGTT
jgi:hypothetical protein